MRHSRDEVIERVEREFERLDRVVASLTPAEWRRPVPRSETKEPWTVKDALAHIVYWKSDGARVARKLPVPQEMRGLNINAGNTLVYLAWKDRSPAELLAWHRETQEQVLAALRQAPEKWFSSRERKDHWPYDLDGHSSDHRSRDIEAALTREARAGPR
jgi:hypothetical protein